MLLLAVAALAPLQFHIDAPEFVNAVYHVACLTDRIACSRPLYAKFWNEQYHVTREDGTRFEEFRKTMERLEEAAGKIAPAPFLPNYASYYPPLRLRGQIMAAALASKSAADFERRAAAYAPREAVQRMARVFDATEKRLHPWWVSTGAAIVNGKRKGLEAQVRMFGVPALARELARFFDVTNFSRDLYIHIVPSPAFDGKDATASPNLNHFCIEATHDFDAGGFSSIGLHELTHSLYELAPQEKKLALMREFVGSNEAAAQGFYMFLNEAVATAAQLLLLERNSKHDDDPYHDPYIPRLGNATLPLLREALRGRKTLFEGFAGPYLEAARKTLGADADTLGFRFSAPALAGTEDLREGFREGFAPRFVATGDEGKNYARMRVVRVVGSGEAPPFTAGSRGRGVVWLAGPDELLVVSQDRATAVELGKRVAEWKGKVEAGLLFTID